MRNIILDSPKQLKTGLSLAKNIKLEGKFDKIIICGMGGSALPANILITYFLNNLKMPVFSHRTYNLPAQADKNSLIVAISYSGNTEETVSAYKQAIEKGYKVVAIATGGKLKELAEKNNQPIALIPNNAEQPRFSLGYQTAALLKILSNSGVIEDKTNEILEISNNLNPTDHEEQGKDIAKKLVDKIPVIYASSRLRILARIWKIKFNETSKIMSFWNYFPELNHNEMVGLTNLKGNFHFLTIQDENDHKGVQKRMKLFFNLAKEKGTDVDIIQIKGKNTLDKMWNCLVLADWVTYYLALEYGQDPTPVKIVEEFKKKLKE